MDVQVNCRYLSIHNRCMAKKNTPICNITSDQCNDYDPIYNDEVNKDEPDLTINGCKTHVVFKKEDADKYLTDEEVNILAILLEKIESGRKTDNKKTDNKYFVCNEDEPYAKYVENIILTGESLKR